ncbi:MAG: hypothetical protein ACRDI2_05210, partial [Chloroflexota bacterium]
VDASASPPPLSPSGRGAGGEEDDSPLVEVEALPPLPVYDPRRVTAARLRALLWEHVSITRSSDGLRVTEAKLRRWLGEHRVAATRASVELANMLVVGWQMARAGLAREESRGAHYRSDFPEPRQEWRRRLAVRLERPQPLEMT